MSDIIYGRNSVISALSGNDKPNKVLLSNRNPDKRVLSLCRKFNIKPESVNPHVLDKITKGANHQGVLAYVSEFTYEDFNEILNLTRNKENSLLLVLDGVEDPVNFGSMIRTASCFGVDGIIIMKQRQVQVTPVVRKISTGAEQFVPISRVTNLSNCLKRLKDEGYWIVAADGAGKQYYDDVDYNGKIAIIIGSEGRGISRLVLQNSDYVVRIPISGPITSLNAAISGALMLAQAVTYRRKNIKK